MTQNYLEFGRISRGKKKKYEQIKGNIYDWYMLPRYFNDIYLLDKLRKTKNIKLLSKLLHHKEDLKLNLVNFVLLKTSKSNSFYEYGQTLFEKIFFIKFFSKLFNIKFNYNINWNGNDISDLFNFFCDNFYTNLKVNTSKKFKLNKVEKSVFFAKGVTLLYLKNNLQLLKKIINKSNCGSFDISLKKNNNIFLLNTGKKLYYPEPKLFFRMLKNCNKEIVIRNFKIKNNSIYLEIIYGNKKIIQNFLNFYNKLIKNFKKNILLTKTLDLESKFIHFSFIKDKILK